MIKCLICDIDLEKQIHLTNHLKKYHSMNYKQYYDTFLKNDKDGICLTCGKETKFERNQYRQFCSVKCMRQNVDIQKRITQTNIKRYGGTGLASKEIKLKVENTNLEKYGVKNSYQIDHVQKNAHKLENIRKSIINFELTNNCTWIRHLIEKYGHGWLNANLNIDYVYFKNHRYVKNSDISIIENYYNQKYKHFENSVLSYIRTFYDGEVICNSKKYIYPYELDFYFPELNIGIECNGSYWHSIEAGIYDKNYHLMKTNLCEKSNIRLIHIFEDDWGDNSIQEHIKNVFTNNEVIDSNIKHIVLDRSKDDVSKYLKIGYQIESYSEPKLKTNSCFSIYDCGTCTLYLS